MPETAKILKEEGIPEERISKFYPRHISNYPELLEADVILTMERSHLNAIPQQYRNKAFLISEFAGEPPNDIIDPYGEFLESYRKIAKELKYYLHKILDILIEKNVL